MVFSRPFAHPDYISGGGAGGLTMGLAHTSVPRGPPFQDMEHASIGRRDVHGQWLCVLSSAFSGPVVVRSIPGIEWRGWECIADVFFLQQQPCCRPSGMEWLAQGLSR